MSSALTVRPVHVAGVHKITPRIVRITLAGEHLRDHPSPAPDAQVKLFFPLPGQPRPASAPPVAGDVVSWYRAYLAMPDGSRPPMRTYTVRAVRAHESEMDVDFVLHDDGGPASRWAARARPGDTIAVLGPTGSYVVPDGTRWRLIVGDETAVPAIGALIEEAPADAVVRAFAEVADAAERQTFHTAADVDIRWVFRNGAGNLLDTLRSADFPDGAVYAWVAGEAGLVRSIRRHLVHDRGVDKRAITFTGYWRAGMSEEDVGRDGLRRIEAGQNPVDDGI